MKDWELQKEQKVAKIFADGYWMVFFYDDKRQGNKLFNGAGGGTYSLLKNGKYNESLDYYSWDSTAVGKTYSFDYKVNTKAFKQYGFIDSEKYQHYAINEKFDRIIGKEQLKNNDLEGVWEMTEGTWGGKDKFGEGNLKNITARMIFQYPNMSTAQFSKEKKEFSGADLFSYQFDGTTFDQYCEAHSWDSSKVGTSRKFKIVVNGDSFTKTSDTWPGFKEVFKRIK
jgi:hypothetical protein